MLRFLSFICVFSVVVLVPALVLAQDDSPKTGVLTGDKVRVRTGASKNHKILAELPKGIGVKVVAKKGDWYEIEMPDEVILVVSKNYVKEIKKEGGILEGQVTGENVNVRTGTEATDVRVGALNKGDKVTIVGSKTGWYKIRPPKGFTAYISADYVKLGEGVVEPQKKTDTPRVAGDAISEKEKLLRDLLEQQKAIGERITIKSMADGTPFDMNKQYKVAINSYRGGGGGGHLTKGAGIPKAELTERMLSSTIKDLRYFLMKWIENAQVVTPQALGNWEVIPAEWVAKAKEPCNMGAVWLPGRNRHSLPRVVRAWWVEGQFCS